MTNRSLLLRLPAVLLAALRRPLARPGVVVLFLLLNLAAALVVVAPVRSLLSAELDDNLYGERMEEDASWRWYDTVDRQHPRAVGDLSPWTALFSDEGVGWDDVAAVSGPPAAVLLAGLLLFLVHAPLHVGYLAVARRRWDGGAATRGIEPERGATGVVAEAVRRAPAALVLGILAALAYVLVYALVYVAPAAPLARFAEFLQKEWVHLGQVWLRLALTVLLLLAVKVLFDLAKLGLVVDGGGRRRVPGAGLGAAFALAGREMRRRGWAYLAVDLVLGVLLLAVAAAWWLVSAPLVPETWLGLVILFVLHQVFLAVRIVLRLAHLEAAGDIHARATALPAPGENLPPVLPAEEPSPTSGVAAPLAGEPMRPDEPFDPAEEPARDGDRQDRGKGDDA